MTDQYELASRFSSRPQQFAWLLGAGASANAGLPTATDIIWDLKRRFYRREENQDTSRLDLQLDGVRARIQSFMLSRGFPPDGDPGEYTQYFEKIFGEDRERQRQYIAAILSEDNVRLTVGSKVFGALLATGKTRVAFTTNFDSVVERAVAEVSGKSLSAFHIEGAVSAKRALDNEEFPIYCKLHGDFRYDSIKNLEHDLAQQDANLSEALINAASRFGLIVAGYSGRDESIMRLLNVALSSGNPFPHGLFWTGIKRSRPRPEVANLIEAAKGVGVDASYVEVETFDAFMLRLWRNLDGKDAIVDAKIRRFSQVNVSIPRPHPGSGAITRMNALPIIELPRLCQSLEFKVPKDWPALRAIAKEARGELVLTRGETVLCWGPSELARDLFGDVVSCVPHDLTAKIGSIYKNLYIQGFLEEAICRALIRGKPLLTRTSRISSFIICDRHTEDIGALGPLHKLVGRPFGEIAGLLAPPDDLHPTAEKVAWAEAVRISIEVVDEKSWLVIDPDVWIWPPRARKLAVDFLDKRRGDRYNDVYSALLDAWLVLLLNKSGPAAEVCVQAYDGESSVENPYFTLGTRTAYSRRL